MHFVMKLGAVLIGNIVGLDNISRQIQSLLFES